MGGANVTVDYQGMSSAAQTMLTQAEDLNAQFVTAYQTVQSMNPSDWYGKRYDELVTYFNSQISIIKNQILIPVVTNIPTTAGTIANNYAAFNDTSVQVPKGAPKDIPEIALSNNQNSHFVDDAVGTKQTTISNSLDNAVTSLGNMIKTFNSVEWSSAAADATRSTLNTVQTQIGEMVNGLKKQVSDSMNLSRQEATTTEQYNTVQ